MSISPRSPVRWRFRSSAGSFLDPVEAVPEVVVAVVEPARLVAEAFTAGFRS